MQSKAKSIRYNKGKQKSKRKEFQASLAVMVLLGLTWLFGAFMIQDGRLVFSFLFAICNSLQGFFVFLFHCALNREVQKAFTFQFWPRMYRKHFVSTNSASFNSRSTVRRPIRQGTVILDIEEKRRAFHKKQSTEESLDDGIGDSCPALSVASDGLGQKEKVEEVAVEQISMQQVADIVNEQPDDVKGEEVVEPMTVEGRDECHNATEDSIAVTASAMDEEATDCNSVHVADGKNVFSDHDIVSEVDEADSECTHSDCGQSRGGESASRQGRSFTPSNYLTLEVGSPTVPAYLTEDS